MAEQLTDKAVIGEVIGRIPSGVFIITARQGDHRVGMLGSWITQAGFEPPCISVAIHPDRELYELIETVGHFSVNVLSNENMNLMKTFSSYSPEQFNNINRTDTDYGVTLNDAVAVMGCKLKAKLDVSDHHVFIGEVMDGVYLNRELSPMVHLRKSGFNY